MASLRFSLGFLDVLQVHSVLFGSFGLTKIATLKSLFSDFAELRIVFGEYVVLFCCSKTATTTTFPGSRGGDEEK